MTETVHGSGSKSDPWTLKTPSLTSEYQAWRDEAAAPQALITKKLPATPRRPME